MNSDTSTEANNLDFTVTLNGDLCLVVDATPTTCTAIHSEWVDHLKTELFNPPQSKKRKRWETSAAYAKRMRKRRNKE